jgi:hypothetical protein
MLLSSVPVASSKTLHIGFSCLLLRLSQYSKRPSGNFKIFENIVTLGQHRLYFHEFDLTQLIHKPDRHTCFLFLFHFATVWLQTRLLG